MNWHDFWLGFATGFAGLLLVATASILFRLKFLLKGTEDIYESAYGHGKAVQVKHT
jgi:hypothetical protein